MDEYFAGANSILLLSIRPQFVKKLIDGTKRTELRRVKPRLQKGDIVLIYESAPTMALVGFGVVESVLQDRPESLWFLVGCSSGISKEEFNNYYSGVAVGYAINLSEIVTLVTPVALDTLRRQIDGFHPPQSYRYLCRKTAATMCNI